MLRRGSKSLRGIIPPQPPDLKRCRTDQGRKACSRWSRPHFGTFQGCMGSRRVADPSKMSRRDTSGVQR